jgi:WD40 repeat protein
MPDAIQTLAASRDGKLIAAGLWSGHIPVISAATGGILHTIEAHESLISDIAFSPDGQFIATASWDFTAKVLSAADGALVRDFKGHASEVNAAAVNLQGSLVATGGYNSPTVKLWSLETGKLKALLSGHTGTVSCAAFSPDGKTLATGSWDGAIALHPMTEDAPARMLKGHDRAVETLAFSHRGDLLASAGIDGTIFLWNTLTPDDKLLASGGGDTVSNVLIWSLETGEVVRTLKHNNKISSVAFSPDGETLASATSFDKDVFLWSVATGERTGELKGNTDSIFGIAYAPDGTMLASAGVDQAVRIWSLPSGKLLHTMEGHADLVNTVAFSSGGRLLVSGGRDAATKIWNTETGQLLATLMAFEDGNWFATDPAGRFDCSNCAAGGRDSGKQYIRWRAGNALYEPDQFFRKFWEPGLIAKTLQAGRVEPIRGLDQVAANMPPEISIIGRKGALRSPAVARERTHTVTIQVRDLGGGAQNVELTCQGRPVSAEARDITPENAPPGVRTYSFSVDLSPGMNRLVARAYSRSGIPSRDMYGEMFVSYEPDQPPPMDLYLLTVGINEYKNASSNLTLAAPDADGFRDAVLAGGAGLFREVHATELRNARATRVNLRGALDAIQSSAGVNDTVVIYLAGHGTTIPAGWVFITHEITQWDNEFLAENALSDMELKGFLEGLKSRRVALILDACQSGEMVFAMRGADEKTLVDLGRSMGVYIFAASTDTQYAYEDKGLGHGVFTYALLQGLNGEADGLGGSKSGTVEAEELKSFARSKVPELMKSLYGVEQYPVTYGMSYGGIDGLGPTLAEVK